MVKWYTPETHPELMALAEKLYRLPEDDGTERPRPGDRVGYMHALDDLRHNPRALAMLLEVADGFTTRPTYKELMEMADKLLSMRGEVRRLTEFEDEERPDWVDDYIWNFQQEFFERYGVENDPAPD
jgi:hypothetical protein